MKLRARSNKPEPVYAPHALILIHENFADLMDAYVGFRRELAPRESFLAALQAVLSKEDLQTIKDFRDGNADPLYGKGHGRKTIEDEIPQTLEQGRLKLQQTLDPVAPKCFACGESVYDEEAWQRSLCVSDIASCLPLIRRLEEILRDPNTDLGFKTMDPNNLADLASELESFGESAHDSVHNPAKRKSVLFEEVSAKSSSAVAIAMTVCLLEPEQYSAYWQALAAAGVLVPEDVLEQLQN